MSAETIWQMCQDALRKEIGEVQLLLEDLGHGRTEQAVRHAVQAKTWSRLATDSLHPLHMLGTSETAEFRARHGGMESASWARLELLSGVSADLELTTGNAQRTYGALLEEAGLWSPELAEAAAQPTVAARFRERLAAAKFASVDALFDWFDDFSGPGAEERGVPVPELEEEEERLRLKDLADALHGFEKQACAFRSAHLNIAQKQPRAGPRTLEFRHLLAITQQARFFPDLWDLKERRAPRRAWGW